MEEIEDLLVKTIQNANDGGDVDARARIMQGMNDSMRPFYEGKSPAEVTELTNIAQNFITNVFNKVNIPLETKLVTEREFLFYKLANDKDICPNLRSWKREEGKFLITYKKHDPIDILTRDKKNCVISLIIKLHGMGIILNSFTKNNIVYNQYEGIKLIGFHDSIWIDSIDDQSLLNNEYGISFSNVEELLTHELKMVDEIFDEDEKLLEAKLELKTTDELDSVKKEKFDNHFHSSDEENIYY